MDEELNEFKAKVREAVANYISSEGCSCCSDYEAHKEHAIALADLLDAKYDDGSGFDYGKYRTRKEI